MTALVATPSQALQHPADRLQQLLQEFLSSQDVKASSKGLYQRTLQQYFNWIEKGSHNLAQADRALLLTYKEHLLASGKSALTVASYLTSVRRFYEWTEANKYYPNVAKGIRTPKRKQQFRKQALTPAQAKQLLGYLQGQSLRDYALVNLLLRTGLRTIEAARADVADLTWKGSQRVLLIQGKGRDEKDNFVLLTDKAYQPLKAYLDSRKPAPSEPLFCSDSNNSKGSRLTTRTISNLAKQALQAIGLDDRSFTAHSLRHTTAVNILRAGGSLETVQHTLRHANPATTQIYTATLKEEQRLAHSGEALLDSLY